MAIKSSDQLTVVDLTDGVSVILTNDSHTFPGGVSAALASSTTTTVIAMRGTEQIPASVSNASIVSPTGVTTSVDTDPTQPTITINVSTAVTAGGTVDIPVSLDNGNLIIHKLFTFQIAFKGTGGDSAQWYSGTGITGTSTTATIFSGSGITAAKVGDMYLNTDTMNTYRCTVAGAASVAKWVYVGNIKGDQGATGAGAVWYTGTAITGTSTTGTIFSGSGITDAKVGDMYLNTSTYNTYRCTVAGAASVAKWVYVNNIKGVQGDTGPAGKGVQSTTRYYILQSTTPVKPAVKPPGGNWVTTEPSYTTGSTNSLYFTDLTVFSDGSFAYSDVSLSSSYEAAKAAFNEAVTAEAAAAEAAKIATNYLSYNSNTGLDVGYTGTSAKTRIKGDGVEVFDGDGDSAAFFGTVNNVPTSRVGYASSGHSVIDADGMRIYAGNGTTLLANLGYGGGAAESGTATAPYYTFGRRISGSSAGNLSMAEGQSNTASGYCSHAEGSQTTASGTRSHAEGEFSKAIGGRSHAEGYLAEASGDCSHAEGASSEASGDYSHAEGRDTTASGYCSHVEGENSVASGRGSHAEGGGSITTYTTASGDYSHAQNHGTVAAKKAQTALGTFNIKDESTSTTHPGGESDYGKYAVIVGNGGGIGSRSNAAALDWSGNLSIAGNLTQVPSTGAITYQTDWGAYSGQTPVLKKAANVVSLNGAFAFSGTAFTSSATEVTVCTIPEGFRPPTMVGVLCQGSGTNLWMLRVNTNGNVAMSRYRNAAGTYQQVGSSSWFPFSASWIVS